MSSSHIKTAQIGGVLRLGLSRPDKKNALTNQMYQDLAEALVAAEADDRVRVVVMYGEGGSFSAGNDLRDFMEAPPSGESSPPFRFLLALAGFKKPLVVQVEGAAVGIGTTILLHADLAYAAEGVRFQLPFVQLGLVPEAGSSLLLPRMLGHAKAAELLLFGEPFGGAQALEYGLINELLPDAEACARRVMERAERLAAQPPGAVMETKALLKQPIADTLRTTISKEGARFVRRLHSPEARMAMSSFFKR